jgi:hypothetical protein
MNPQPHAGDPPDGSIVRLVRNVWSLPAALAALVALLALLAAPVKVDAMCVANRQGEVVCGPADSRCVVDRYGDWHCSGSGGDAVLNRVGNPVCGVGRCVADIHGEVMCSREARGGAALDRYSTAVCASGCAPARAELCKRLVK